MKNMESLRKKTSHIIRIGIPAFLAVVSLNAGSEEIFSLFPEEYYSRSDSHFTFVSPKELKQTSQSKKRNKAYAGRDDKKCYLEFRLGKGVTWVLWPGIVHQVGDIRKDQSFPNFILDQHGPKPMHPKKEYLIQVDDADVFVRLGGTFRPDKWKVYTTKYIEKVGFCVVIVGKTEKEVLSNAPLVVRIAKSIKKGGKRQSSIK